MKKPEDEKSDSSKAHQRKKHTEKPKDEDRFYSDDEDDSPKMT